MMMGVVYTETVVHMAPPAFEKDVPYQVAIVSLDTGERVTARIEGAHVSIDDRVTLVDTRDGVPFFRKNA
jgi:uncharacterized OB-fold protein